MSQEELDEFLNQLGTNINHSVPPLCEDCKDTKPDIRIRCPDEKHYVCSACYLLISIFDEIRKDCKAEKL